MKKFEIILEQEVVNELNDNVDVVIHCDDGKKYFAIFITLENIKQLMEQDKSQIRPPYSWAKGAYFALNNCIIVEKLNYENVATAVRDLFEKGEEGNVFTSIRD